MTALDMEKTTTKEKGAPRRTRLLNSVLGPSLPAAARDAGAEVVILDDAHDARWSKAGFRDVGIVLFDASPEEGSDDEDEGWTKAYRRRADDASQRPFNGAAHAPHCAHANQYLRNVSEHSIPSATTAFLAPNPASSRAVARFDASLINA